IESALETIERIRKEGDRQQAEIYDQLERYYRRRLAVLEDAATPDSLSSQETGYRHLIAQQLRDAERAAALKLRDENKIHDEVLRTLERELDLLDARFAESQY